MRILYSAPVRGRFHCVKTDDLPISFLVQVHCTHQEQDFDNFYRYDTFYYIVGWLMLLVLNSY
jgi:hypothetical protein